jgi:hypothetical protein
VPEGPRRGLCPDRSPWTRRPPPGPAASDDPCAPPARASRLAPDTTGRRARAVVARCGPASAGRSLTWCGRRHSPAPRARGPDGCTRSGRAGTGARRAGLCLGRRARWAVRAGAGPRGRVRAPASAQAGSGPGRRGDTPSGGQRRGRRPGRRASSTRAQPWTGGPVAAVGRASTAGGERARLLGRWGPPGVSPHPHHAPEAPSAPSIGTEPLRGVSWPPQD